MLKKLILGIVILFTLQTTLHANTAPTKEEIAKLYVATFKRAPDAGGLDYWAGSGLSLKEIAGRFFYSSEIQEEYPPGSTTSDFVEAVYLNLFNRQAEPAGIAYWADLIDRGVITKADLILFAIDTDSAADAAILKNKTTVAKAFANAGLTDKTAAKDIMAGITGDDGTVTDPLNEIVEILLKGNTLYTNISHEMGTFESWSFNDDLTAATWIELVGGDGDSGSATLRIDGMTLIFGSDDEENITTIVVLEIQEDYLLFTIEGVNGRLYFDKAKAKEYFLPDGLAGETVITYFPDGNISTVVETEYYPDGTIWEEKVTVFEENGETSTFVYTVYYPDGTWYTKTEIYDKDEMITESWERSDGTYGDCHFTRYDNEEINTSKCTTYNADGTLNNTIDNTFDENGINLTRDHKMIELDGSWYHTIVIYDGTSSTNIIHDSWEKSDGTYGDMNFTYHSNGILESSESTKYNSDISTYIYILDIYDENGLQIYGENKLTNADGISTHNIHTTYDGNGKIHTTYTQSDGLVYGTIDYTYHSNGELSTRHNERHYKNPGQPWAVIYLVTIWNTDGNAISYEEYFAKPW